MNQYLSVAEDENEDSMEVPLEEDGNLLLSTLTAQFPGACGLKYRKPTTSVFRGVRLAEGTLYPPAGVWSSPVYIIVYPKENPCLWILSLLRKAFSPLSIFKCVLYFIFSGLQEKRRR